MLSVGLISGRYVGYLPDVPIDTTTTWIGRWDCLVGRWVRAVPRRGGQSEEGQQAALH